MHFLPLAASASFDVINLSLWAGAVTRIIGNFITLFDNLMLLDHDVMPAKYRSVDKLECL